MVRTDDHLKYYVYIPKDLVQLWFHLQIQSTMYIDIRWQCMINHLNLNTSHIQWVSRIVVSKTIILSQLFWVDFDYFWSNWGRSKHCLKIEPPLSNLACLNQLNTLYVCMNQTLKRVVVNVVIKIDLKINSFWRFLIFGTCLLKRKKSYHLTIGLVWWNWPWPFLSVICGSLRPLIHWCGALSSMCFGLQSFLFISNTFFVVIVVLLSSSESSIWQILSSLRF